jgi:hypothetical protein
MTHNEIRLVKHLIDLARRIKRVHKTWAWEDWSKFQQVMLRRPQVELRPTDAEFEVSDRQFTRCLRHAFVEVSYQP